ncbi:MAG: SDR family oxidoreductase [Phycisphaerae bacterium]|nr:SDR family oxidoreductase [Phycisphaerae bacterium]
MDEERWLITGASGQLGGYVLESLIHEVSPQSITALAGAGPVVECGAAVQRIDLRDRSAVRTCVEAVRPTHVLHLGGVTTVGAAFADPQATRRINVETSAVLAECVARHGGRLVFASTDMVFDGTAAPYREDAPPCPVSEYGRSKVTAEQAVLAVDNTLVVRLSLMYGFPRTHRTTTFVKQIESLRRGESLRLFTDEFRTPMWFGDAAAALIALCRSGQAGILHVAGPERLSRYDMARHFASVLGIMSTNFVASSRLSIESPEPRPADLSLNVSRLRERFPRVVPGPIRAESLRGHAGGGD